MNAMTSLDILYLTLSVCVSVVTLFSSVTLIYLMFIFRDVTKISDTLREVVNKVDHYITKPIMMTKSVIDFVTPYLETAQGVMKKRKGKS
jgi:hypothetical protein